MDTSKIVISLCERCKKEAPCLSNEDIVGEYGDKTICEVCIFQMFEEYKQRIAAQMEKTK
jgi:hypothetical protein